MITVAALYRFAPFDDPAALRGPMLAICAGAGIKGTLLLAREGINGTVAGPAEGIGRLLDHIRALPGCADLEVKFSSADDMPFHRMKVRLRREIVTMGRPAIDPLRDAGHYVDPAQWNALIDDPDTVVVDTRNAYEIRVGSFAGAIDPGTHSFSEFPDWVDANRQLFAGKRVAMFCTGGIRCEKATAYLKAEGVKDVFHLKGGILGYLEHVPAAESRWQGECFVFDERVAVGHGVSPGTHKLCRACRMPVSPADTQSPHYVEGISCPSCHGTRDATQIAACAERHRQVMLASERGERHVGAAF